MTTSHGGSDRASHLVHDELGTPDELAADCREIGRDPRFEHRMERAARAALSGRPLSLRFEDYPAEVAKREIRVSDAAARLANALHLHLD
jgi:hypothetical protein